MPPVTITIRGHKFKQSDEAGETYPFSQLLHKRGLLFTKYWLAILAVIAIAIPFVTDGFLQEFLFQLATVLLAVHFVFETVPVPKVGPACEKIDEDLPANTFTHQIGDAVAAGAPEPTDAEAAAAATAIADHFGLEHHQADTAAQARSVSLFYVPLGVPQGVPQRVQSVPLKTAVRDELRGDHQDYFINKPDQVAKTKEGSADKTQLEKKQKQLWKKAKKELNLRMLIVHGICCAASVHPLLRVNLPPHPHRITRR